MRCHSNSRPRILLAIWDANRWASRSRKRTASSVSLESCCLASAIPLLCRAALFIQRSLDLGLSSRAGLVEPLIALVAGHLNRSGDVGARFVNRLLGVVPRACGTVHARLSCLHRLRQRFEEEILTGRTRAQHERTNDEGCKVDGYQALSLIGENDRTELLTITRGFERRQRFAPPRRSLTWL